MAVDLVLILIVVNLAFLTRFEQSYLYYKFIPVMWCMMAVSLVIKHYEIGRASCRERV